MLLYVSMCPSIPVTLSGYMGKKRVNVRLVGAVQLLYVSMCPSIPVTLFQWFLWVMKGLM